MIDFKSLGVRQLGSLYEGLLEFNLRIADQKLAVTKEKGKEVYQPFAKVNKPLATLNKGDVYLENDKRERKATGSYYTPDYIVKYIVQHTVGPVLDRKFAELAPRLRSALRQYRDYAKLVEARNKSAAASRGNASRGNASRRDAIHGVRTGDGDTQTDAIYRVPTHDRSDSPHTFWNNPAMQQLVDECLNVRVLDPAMGSGHFLVEVVDYVSNRLISFLNGWSENPVWAFLDQTRSDIMDEMERQYVSIDADRLTRVALLKRAVLKRCVYGVDLNTMAVELAKVSLWLDAFTLGAPLSFLDHHLKWGNSLIGARIRDVQQYLDVRANEQSDMFSGSKFAGVMLATDLMRQVSYLSDNTVEQSRRSAAAYHDASDHLAPYKRVLDVYTSQYFGNQPPKKGKTDYVRLFLRDPQTEAWLQDPAAPLDDQLIPSTHIAATARRAADDKHFFHWELEFPEVFFAPATPGGSDVQLVEGGGFDAVVGNPPYAIVKSAEEQLYFSQVYDGPEYQVDYFVLFVEKGIRLIDSEGSSSMIVPTTLFAQHFYSKIRKLILTRSSVDRLLHFKYPVFGDATVESGIYVITKHEPVKTNGRIRAAFILQPQLIEKTDYEELSQQFLLEEVNQYDFNILLAGERGKIVSKVRSISQDFRDIADISAGIVPYEVGKGKPPQSRQDLEKRIYDASHKKDDTYRQYIMGTDVTRFNIDTTESRYLKYGSCLAAPRKPETFNASRKIIIRQIGDSLISSVDDDQLLCLKNCHTIILFGAYSYLFAASVLNSRLANFIHKTTVPEEGRVFAEVKTVDLAVLPIRRITFTTPAAERERLTQGIIARYAAGDNAGTVQAAQAAIDAAQTDVVHDLLAHLAQRMIDLNKQKQAEIKRFLGWLEGVLRIRPQGQGGSLQRRGAVSQGRDISRPHKDISRPYVEHQSQPSTNVGTPYMASTSSASHPYGTINDLKGKSIIQNYLGDYQKNEAETPWREFRFRLHENRTRLGVALADAEGEIEQQYEASLGTLLPLKRELARTDALIDKIVYRLYGLTDAEIELIERPQYEQALVDAKAQVVADDEITDDEEKIARIADGILPAAQRFFERVEPRTDEEMLDGEHPNWRTLPPAAPTFLLTGDYNLRTMPEHMDFSTAIIPYTKAVEVALHERIFAPFRVGVGGADCHNAFLQGFMRGEKHLTLGSYMLILSSTKETALRSFIARQLADAARHIFGDGGLVTILNDTTMRDIRNKAAHEDVLTRTEAQQIRGWALGILGKV